MKNLGFLVPNIFLAGSLFVYSVATEPKGSGEFTSDQFSKSSIYSNCHGSSFGEWSSLMRSNVNNDFFYQEIPQEYSIAAEAQRLCPEFCSRCHTPIGVVSAEIPPLNDSELSEVLKEGVQCDLYHVVSESEGIGNTPYVLEPGDVKWSRSMSGAHSPSHEIEGREFYDESAYCGMCQNIYHPVNNLILAATYTKWEEGPYAERGVTCQDCHTTPGIVAFERNPGKASFSGPERKHVYTHYFSGGNAFVTEVVSEGRHEKKAIEYLQHAASLDVNAPESAEPRESVEVEVKIINTGAGYKIPTGVTEEREMWLELIVEDAKGNMLYHSRFLDEKGRINPEETIYHTIFANSEGKITVKVWEAESLLSDNRIALKESAVEKHHS